MYLTFPTLVELIVEAGITGVGAPQEIPHLLGISASSWYAYRSGTRRPNSAAKGPRLRARVASLVAEACAAVGRATVDPDRYVFNLFRYQDFLLRLDALFPSVLPAVAADLAAAVLSADGRDGWGGAPAAARECLEVLLTQDTGGRGRVLGWLVTRCTSVVREVPLGAGAAKVHCPLDPADPVGSFLALAAGREAGGGGALSLPEPVCLDVVMCCADRVAVELSSRPAAGTGPRVAAAGTAESSGHRTRRSPAYPVV